MKTKVLLVCLSACAFAHAEFTCALTDPLEWIYPDSEVAEAAPFAETDVPLGGVADVNVLFNGLEPGKPVSVSADAPDAEWFRFVEVFVDRNTGLHGFTAKPAETNTWSVRKAPYWAYEALAPIAGGAFTPTGATAAVRFKLKKFPAKPGALAVNLVFAQGAQSVRRAFKVNVHGARVPDVGRGSFKYTNWFNLTDMATRHGLELWSDAHFEMIGRYAKLAAEGRQNCAWIPLSNVFDVKNGTPVLNEARLARIVDVYTAAGIWWIEGGHLCRFNGGWGAKNFLPLFSKNVSTTPAGAADVARIAVPLVAAVEKHGWKDRWIQHVADEPDVVNAAEYRQTCAIARRYMPGVKMMDAVENCAVAGALDMLCPKVDMWQKDRAAFDFQRTNCHDSVWCYTCCVPGGRWLNRTLDCHLLKPLYVFWCCSEFGLDGFLHWGYNMYQKNHDPFNNTTVDNWGTNGGSALPPGDTHVVYPGAVGPWSGARFEATRQGVEDYELLEQLRHRDAAKFGELSRRVVRSFNDYELDVKLYRATRREILSALD